MEGFAFEVRLGGDVRDVDRLATAQYNVGHSVSIEALYEGDQLSGREAIGILVDIVGFDNLITMVRWRDFDRVKYIGILRSGPDEELVNPEPTRLRMQWGVNNPCQDNVDMDAWAKGEIQLGRAHCPWGHEVASYIGVRES